MHRRDSSLSLMRLPVSLLPSNLESFKLPTQSFLWSLGIFIKLLYRKCHILLFFMICGITIMAYDIRQHGSSDERNIVYSVLCSFKFNKNAFIFEFISAK